MIDFNPVFLMHGMGMSADSWIMHADTAEDCVPCTLADMGMNVWIGNSRGAWDYSFHNKFDKEKDP